MLFVLENASVLANQPEKSTHRDFILRTQRYTEVWSIPAYTRLWRIREIHLPTRKHIVIKLRIRVKYSLVARDDHKAYFYHPRVWDRVKVDSIVEFYNLKYL